VVVVTIGAALVLGYLIWSSTTLVQTECEVCIEFRGQEQCRRGSGPTQEDAKRAARKAACGVMAAGMDASIACDNTPAKVERCPAGAAP
jgi:hypothetical protein